MKSNKFKEVTELVDPFCLVVSLTHQTICSSHILFVGAQSRKSIGTISLNYHHFLSACSLSPSSRTLYPMKLHLSISLPSLLLRHFVLPRSVIAVVLAYGQFRDVTPNHLSVIGLTVIFSAIVSKFYIKSTLAAFSYRNESVHN